MPTIYTRVGEVSPSQLSVNLVVEIDRESFRYFALTDHQLDEDDAVGELVVGDRSGCITMIVTGRHMRVLGLLSAGNDKPCSFIIKNVLPSLVFGRLRVELNRFSSVDMHSTQSFSINKTNNMSLVDYDSLGKFGG